MGIDITIIHENGKPADDIFTDNSHMHIACAIEFVCKEGISVGMRSECYALIDEITNYCLSDKYDSDDRIWSIDDIKDMARCLKYNVKNNHINMTCNIMSDDVKKIKKFLEFLIKNKLCIDIW